MAPVAIVSPILEFLLKAFFKLIFAICSSRVLVNEKVHIFYFSRIYVSCSYKMFQASFNSDFVYIIQKPLLVFFRLPNLLVYSHFIDNNAETKLIIQRAEQLTFLRVGDG